MSCQASYVCCDFSFDRRAGRWCRAGAQSYQSAEKSLLIKQFTFSEPTLLEAVTDRKNAGVEVRVMLNPKRSGGDRANDDTFDYFKKNGVSVRWANPKFYVTHEKSIVVDAKTALIATFNLCVKYLPKRATTAW